MRTSGAVQFLLIAYKDCETGCIKTAFKDKSATKIYIDEVVEACLVVAIGVIAAETAAVVGAVVGLYLYKLSELIRIVD